MGVYKHTLIFEAPGHGASESLYYEFPGPSTVDTAVSALQGIKYKRALLLGKEWQIKGERVEQVYDDSSNKQVRVGQVFRFFLPGVQAQPSAPENVSLQVSFSDSNKRNKKLAFLCGPPASLFPGANALDLNQTALPGNWLSSFNSWRALLISLGAGWYSAPTTQEKSIVGYSFDANTGQVTYTLGNAMTWPNTDKPIRVSVEFPLSKSPLDGVQLVIPTGALTCYTAQPRPAAPWTVKGTMRLLGANLIKLSTLNTLGVAGTITPQVPMSRKRGRPLLVSRGRVAVKNRW